MASRRQLFGLAAGLATAGTMTGLALRPRASSGGVRGFPNVPLVTHDGRKVRFYDDLISGRVVMINFMYADCEGICPTMTRNLQAVQQMLGEEVGRSIHMYSFSLRPEVDTPAKLEEYRAMHDIPPGWTFLTGRPGDVELVRRKIGFADLDPELDRDITQHVGLVMCGNEPRDRWAACPALSKPSAIYSLVRSVEGVAPV